MNCVNIPTKIDDVESVVLISKTASIVLNHFAKLAEKEIEYDKDFQCCFDSHGRVLIRFTPDDPDTVLNVIEWSCPKAMDEAKAESTESNVQYPNLAFHDVDFVTLSKDDVNTICNGIDKLCNLALGGDGGINDLDNSDDPDLQAMGISFARLFDRQGGLIYNEGHHMRSLGDGENSSDS